MIWREKLHTTKPLSLSYCASCSPVKFASTDIFLLELDAAFWQRLKLSHLIPYILEASLVLESFSLYFMALYGLGALWAVRVISLPIQTDVWIKYCVKKKRCVWQETIGTDSAKLPENCGCFFFPSSLFRCSFWGGEREERHRLPFF